VYGCDGKEKKASETFVPLAFFFRFSSKLQRKVTLKAAVPGGALPGKPFAGDGEGSNLAL
jgi:hypothetical protein